MKALIWTKDSKVELVDRSKPTISRPDQVILKIVQSGVCGTDRGIVLGKFHAEVNTILGHEAVGIVEEIGSAVTGVSVGDRVVVNPTLYCGSCRFCLRGELNFCVNKSGNEIGIDRHGTFADLFLIEERFVHVIPDGMSLDRAVLIEPLVCSLNNLQAGSASCGERIAVLGAGPMGVLTAMLALHLGASVRVVEPDDFRRQVAQRILGTERCQVVAPAEADAGDEIDLVVDVVGTLLEEAIDMVRPNGRVVIMGFNTNAVARVKPLGILLKGVKIIGAGDYNSLLFPKGIELARVLPLEKLITDRFSISEFSAAFAQLSPRQDAPYGAMKVLLTQQD